MISLQKLEEDILECEKHLTFLKTAFQINNDLKSFAESVIDDQSELSSFNELASTVILNIHAINTISQLETSIILKSLHFAKSDFEKTYIIKHAYLIIYETFKTLYHLKINLRLMCNNELLNAEYQELETVLKRFNKFVGIDNKVQKIRNKISGHITPSFLEYYSSLEIINVEDDIEKVIQFRLVLNQLNDVLYKMITK